MKSAVRRISVVVAVALTSACLVNEPIEPEPITSELRMRREWDFEREVVRVEVAELVWSDGRVERHGVERIRFPDGSLESEREFENDRPVGLWRRWFETGELHSEVRFAGPDERAPMRFYYASGVVAAEGDGLDGVKEGVWVYRHPNGSVSERGTYRAARRHGAWTFWDEVGAKREEGEYAFGSRIGVWKRWNERGEPQSTEPSVPSGDDERDV